MKKFLTLSLLASGISVANAQSISNLPFSNGFSKALEKVFFDYPRNFQTIQGEMVNDEAEYEKYNSTVNLPGSIECLITRFHSLEDTTASYQALMLISDDYEEAAKVYRQVCKQVKATRLHLVDKSIIQFNETYEAPEEGKKFIMSWYYLPVKDMLYKNVKVEVELLTLIGEFRVNVNVHSKPEDTEDRL